MRKCPRVCDRLAYRPIVFSTRRPYFVSGAVSSARCCSKQECPKSFLSHTDFGRAYWISQKRCNAPSKYRIGHWEFVGSLNIVQKTTDGQTRTGSKRHVLGESVYWGHLANMIERYVGAVNGWTV